MNLEKRSLADALQTRLSKSFSRFEVGFNEVIPSIYEPKKLANRVQLIARLFDDGTPAAPPSVARCNALARLRKNKPLTLKDWNLISWGLCDECGSDGKAIDSDAMFSKLMAQLDSQVEGKNINRKMWFGLLSSYFSYSSSNPETNVNWKKLRAKLRSSVDILIEGQVRKKAWSTALRNQNELLTDMAGRSLGEALLQRDFTFTNEIQQYLPVSETSWLWNKVISHQLIMLFSLSDKDFQPLINTMIALAKAHSARANDILSAILTRYESAEFKKNPHLELKQFAQECWQNPQMKSSIRWNLVSNEVRQMMLHWYAKADLEHFFSLLQGTGGVDRDRLHYWLRFIDQIGFTRIVMGADALNNRNQDYVNFRQKNRGRFSRLAGGKTSNNAFVMRIGDYWLVEFSETGNACYAYSAGDLPFKAEADEHHYMDLKSQSAAVFRILHNGDWQYKADYLLKQIGIYPDNKNTISKAVKKMSARETWELHRKTST